MKVVSTQWPGVSKRIIFIALYATLFVLCGSVGAQEITKIPRIGFLSSGSDHDAFRQGLKELGYSEGKNILIEHRDHEGINERVPGLVTELIQLKVDVMVVSALPSIRAAKQATKTIPIVMVATQDPVAFGLIDNLARPGGNITGLSRLTRELSGKRLELTKEVIPGMSSVGVLWNADRSTAFKEYEAPARVLNTKLQSLGVRGPNPDLDGAFQAAVKSRVHALVIIRDSLLSLYPKQIADLAIKHGLATMHETVRDVEVGGLMSYSTSDTESFKRAAVYVDKILKGAKPGDLPVQQATKFELVINLKTAKQIGLTIPPNVLARADRVIR
jgi:putative ABC transport system substrate-binding protein